MKNVIVILVLFFSIISCSKENNIPDNDNKKANFRLEYSQNGDLEFSELTFYITSDKEVTNIQENQVYTKEHLSESKKYVFETKENASKFSFGYSHIVTTLTPESENAIVNTSIKVYKNNQIIFDKNYVLDKNNLAVYENSKELNE
ncbi:hypothetical protein [Tenacibaculum finnmarkense]|uniref:hypothetical protein n=1 Tax=Tenacibaculum finnmarkense TaxID=2781243 RepID=UPI001EFB6FB1|nr:hypothetical protein [Tenacibaculum finnmarkense]MCG8226369.1 hypothetical protein [Tenacibaculum finnmarkense genomovar finnmarkense]